MSQLEIELKQLKVEIINMWNLVHSQVVKSNVAMVNFDKNLAREVVSREKRVNGLELKIDRDLRKYICVADARGGGPSLCTGCFKNQFQPGTYR